MKRYTIKLSKDITIAILCDMPPKRKSIDEVKSIKKCQILRLDRKYKNSKTAFPECGRKMQNREKFR